MHPISTTTTTYNPPNANVEQASHNHNDSPFRAEPWPGTEQFEWLKKFDWTIKTIRLTFGVPAAIAHHIQQVACLSDVDAIVKAQRELAIGQVGF